MGARQYIVLGALACACSSDPPTFGSWKPMAPAIYVEAHLEDSADWNGNQLFVWGNLGGPGWLYTRSTNAWTAASMGPSGRFNAAVVWVGPKLYLWGTTTCGDIGCGAGWTYDPATDGWSRMSNTNAPATTPNALLTYAWTGTEVLVWDIAANVGGLYTPRTDSWRPMSTAGAASNRYYFRSIWTGTELIVWGGSDATGNLNDGARYNPTTDRWTPVTMTGAPRPRFNHVAAWTGTEMLIWGGAGCDEICNEGAAYNPALDRWRTVPNDNGPGKSISGVGVWDGHEVLVWGGLGYDPESGDSGGRWDPVTNSWTKMSSAGAPIVDDDLKTFAFWTGVDMLVWTGFSVGSGAFYTP